MAIEHCDSSLTCQPTVTENIRFKMIIFECGDIHRRCRFLTVKLSRLVLLNCVYHNVCQAERGWFVQRKNMHVLLKYSFIIMHIFPLDLINEFNLLSDDQVLTKKGRNTAPFCVPHSCKSFSGLFWLINRKEFFVII